MSTQELIAIIVDFAMEKDVDIVDAIAAAATLVGSAIAGAVGLGVKALRDLVRSVDKLNHTVEGVIERQDDTEDELDETHDTLVDHEARIRVIESRAKCIKKESDDAHETSGD